MSTTYRSEDWQRYRMDYNDPHRVLEPLEREIDVVAAALAALRDAGVLPHTDYDQARMLAHRLAVQELFEIPWTAITPRMQRLLYAINAIARPAHLIAAGVFCGFTLVSNAGAAAGPGICYAADDLVGVEIRPEEAARAERNVRRLDPSGRIRVLAADAVEVVKAWTRPIDLLYLDVDGFGGKGKALYLDILEAGYGRIPPGALVLAHNSVNAAEKLKSYLEFVRDPAHFRTSVNVVLDGEGLEVSQR
ncbi:MAG: class I SAM-dependent methyltransferase [Planctomycetes bacterium]|nr:class I SAM-dependent methyltransferase [Planctomycetota bacterium]